MTAVNVGNHESGRAVHIVVQVVRRNGLSHHDYSSLGFWKAALRCLGNWPAMLGSFNPWPNNVSRSASTTAWSPSARLNVLPEFVVSHHEGLCSVSSRHQTRSGAVVLLGVIAFSSPVSWPASTQAPCRDSRPMTYAAPRRTCRRLPARRFAVFVASRID